MIRAPKNETAENVIYGNRPFSLNPLNRGKTKKHQIKGKQLNASWDHAFLLRLMDFQVLRP